MNGRLEQEPAGHLISGLFQGFQLNPETLHVDLDKSRGHGEEQTKPFRLFRELFLPELDLEVWLLAL